MNERNNGESRVSVKKCILNLFFYFTKRKNKSSMKNVLGIIIFFNVV